MLTMVIISILRDIEYFQSRLAKIDGFQDAGDYLSGIVKSKDIKYPSAQAQSPPPAQAQAQAQAPAPAPTPSPDIKADTPSPKGSPDLQKQVGSGSPGMNEESNGSS